MSRFKLAPQTNPSMSGLPPYDRSGSGIFQRTWKYLMACATVLACVLALISFAAAQDQSESRGGDFIFKIPAGWQRADLREGSPLRPGGYAGENHISVIISPNVSAALMEPFDTTSTYFLLGSYDLGNQSLQEAFDGYWKGFQIRPGFSSAGPIKSDHSPNGFDYRLAVGGLNEGVGHWVVMLLGAQYGQRMETVVFMTSEIQAFSQTYSKDVASFLGSVRFGPAIATVAPGANQRGRGEAQQPVGVASPGAGGVRPSIERDPALPPKGPMSDHQLPTVPGKFNGIFRAEAREGTDTISMLDFGDPAKATPNYQFLLLFSDGSAMRGLDYQGMDDFHSSVRLDIAGGGKSAYKWGVYQMAGNQGRVVFADPKIAGRQLSSGRLVGDSWPIQEYPDHLDINGSSYVLLDGGVRGMKLEGTYKPFGDKNQLGITFTRDGEFIDQGILKAGASSLGVVGGGVAIGYGFSSPGPGRGTYYIANYTLHLNYSNGQAPGVLFWLGSEASRSVIYIDNVKFQLVQ